jgi:uncharacterized membrane protein YfcA
VPAFFGFIIAMVVGMTGAGGGSLTVPVLVLACGLPIGDAVGTSLVFVTMVKLLSAPAYLLRRQFNTRTLFRLLAGGLPGVLVGAVVFTELQTKWLENAVLAAVGGTMAVLAITNLWNSFHRSTWIPKRDRTHWLPWVAIPIGLEVGFSSAGASALGGIALLSLTQLSPAVIVGTDLLFGLGISVAGSGLHLMLGKVNGGLVSQLLAGGVAGALVGPWLATKVPTHALRTALLLVLSIFGAQLFWRGVSPLVSW